MEKNDDGAVRVPRSDGVEALGRQLKVECIEPDSTSAMSSVSS